MSRQPFRFACKRCEEILSRLTTDAPRRDDSLLPVCHVDRGHGGERVCVCVCGCVRMFDGKMDTNKGDDDDDVDGDVRTRHLYQFESHHEFLPRCRFFRFGRFLCVRRGCGPLSSVNDRMLDWCLWCLLAFKCHFLFSPAFASVCVCVVFASRRTKKCERQTKAASLLSYKRRIAFMPTGPTIV